MLSFQDQEKIKEIVSEFLLKTTLEASVKNSRLENDIFKINLETGSSGSPQLLIGEQGQTLAEIQHILGLLLRRKIVEPFFLDIDINSYKEKKQAYLEDSARTIADEVALAKQEKELAAMPARERRIIHMFLANRSDVVTESRGEGPERRVVVMPKL